MTFYIINIKSALMIPPCQLFVGTYDLGPVVLKTLQSCDFWAVPHIINPFLAAVWTRTWWFGFAIAGFGELLEYFALWAFESFVIFLGTHKGTDFNHDVENLAGSYIEDWLFQGGLASLLAYVFYQTFVFPALLQWKDFWNGKILRALFYSFALFIGCIILPSALHGVEINGYPFGRHLYYIIHLVVFGLVILLQPRAKWAGYNLRQKILFWGGTWLISFTYNLQNTFDWFYSSHVQSWLITAIFLVLITIWSEIKWRWFERIRVDLRFFK